MLSANCKCCLDRHRLHPRLGPFQANVLICEVFDEILFCNASLHNSTFEVSANFVFLRPTYTGALMSRIVAGSKQDAPGRFNWICDWEVAELNRSCVSLVQWRTGRLNLHLLQRKEGERREEEWKGSEIHIKTLIQPSDAFISTHSLPLFDTNVRTIFFAPSSLLPLLVNLNLLLSSDGTNPRRVRYKIGSIV